MINRFMRFWPEVLGVVIACTGVWVLFRVFRSSVVKRELRQFLDKEGPGMCQAVFDFIKTKVLPLTLTLLWTALRMIAAKFFGNPPPFLQGPA